MYILAGEHALFLPKVIVLVAQATAIRETLADLLCGVIVPAREGAPAAAHLVGGEAVI